MKDIFIYYIPSVFMAWISLAPSNDHQVGLYMLNQIQTPTQTHQNAILHGANELK